MNPVEKDAIVKKAPGTTEEHESYWVFVVPVVNLKVTQAVGREFRVCRVTFIDRDKLPRVRKRFGFVQRFSEIARQDLRPLDKAERDPGNALAVMRQYGKPKEVWRECYKRVKNEAAILSLSYLGYDIRRHGRAMGVVGQYPTGGYDYMLADTKSKAIGHGWGGNAHLIPMELDGRWRAFHRKFFFFELLRLLRGEIKVCRNWRDELYSAAVLIGRSVSTVDTPTAFLWNMIALECLLTYKGEKKVVDALPERCEAFLGWVGSWKQQNFEREIRAAYKARCDLVHRGDDSDIDKKMLLFTDDLLFNLLNNIVRFTNLFDSKKALIDFSQKVQAERLLEIRTTVIPKRFLAVSRRYRDKDFDDM